MPPKAARSSSKSGGTATGKNAKPKKVTAQQLAMEQATSDAQKLFKLHEQQRVAAERTDKATRDYLHLDSVVERERLRREQETFVALRRDCIADEKLAYSEYEKHQHWKHIPDACRLPDVHKENQINTFLSVWRDKQRHSDVLRADTEVFISSDMAAAAAATAMEEVPRRMLFIRGEQGVPSSRRRAIIDEELDRCLQAHELAQSITVERDRAASGTAKASLEYYNENLRKVHAQILHSMDFITVNTLMYYDAIIDEADGETLMKLKPESNPVVKFGLWVKVKEMTRSFTSLVFPDVDIRLDPKLTTLPKLPKAMGLSKENVAVRVLQLAFDPFNGYSSAGKEYYPLSCTLKVDILSFSDRPKTVGEWLLRSETDESHSLHSEPYPPLSAEARVEDPSFRISFDVPPTLVIRQPTLLIGKWVEETKEWEPCSHTTFGATFGGTARVDGGNRRATFATGELAQFAVLQEKTFDAPYESWSLKPLSFDRVLLTLEGKHRGDACDREFRILVEDAACKLMAPDDAELARLRENWMEPATLLRELGQAGFNFVLTDADALFLENLTPKSAALEAKAYADIAQFCQYFTIASTKHNKGGEDAGMALFRLSKDARPLEDADDDNYDIPDEQDAWHSVRYRADNCVLSAFTEADTETNLNILENYETHHNLYSMLLPLRGEEELQWQMKHANYLLRRCVLQLLQLVRPLTWG